MPGDLEIISPQPMHRQAWGDLYRAFAEARGVAQSEDMRERVWGWLTDPANENECVLARGADGVLVGFAHFAPVHRPLAASVGGVLNDLYVDDRRRGDGVADALLAHLSTVAAARGWSSVRWICASDNARAIAFYERLARRTTFVTYELSPPAAP